MGNAIESKQLSHLPGDLPIPLCPFCVLRN
jgi:hypothetical protein